MSVEFQCEIMRAWQPVGRLVSEWSTLWRRCPNATTFQRPEWLWSWIETFRPARPVIVAVRRDSELVGLAPLLIYSDGNQRVLGLIGGGVSDYLDVLIDARFERAISYALWEQVARIPGWDRLWLSDLALGSPLLNAPNEFYDAERQTHDVCPVLQFPDDVARDLRAIVPSRQRRNWRNARARLLRAGGGHIEVANSHTLASMIDEMFQLHHVRWADAGQAGVLSEAVVQEFHRRATKRLLAAGVLRLYGLRHKRKLVAFLYAFFEDDTVYCYLQAFDPFLKFLSLGTNILGMVIEDALRLGKRRVDFLRGREAYKYSWGAKDRPTYSLGARRASSSIGTAIPADIAA